MIEVANAYNAWALQPAGASASSAKTQENDERMQFNLMLDNALEKAAQNGQPLDEIFQRAAQRYEVPEELLKIIGWHESGFTPSVTSYAGAMGVMQLMPATAQTLGVTDAYDPEQNIMAGAKLMSMMLEKYDGDLKLALAAYGAGSGAVAKYGGVPPYKEVQDYVDYVLEHLNGDLIGNGKLLEAQARQEDQPQPQPAASGAVATGSAGSVANPYYDPHGIYDYLLKNTLHFSQEDYRVFLNQYLLNMQLQVMDF